jgi:hypothetical protein
MVEVQRDGCARRRRFVGRAVSSRQPSPAQAKPRRVSQVAATSASGGKSGRRGVAALVPGAGPTAIPRRRSASSRIGARAARARQRSAHAAAPASAHLAGVARGGDCTTAESVAVPCSAAAGPSAGPRCRSHARTARRRTAPVHAPHSHLGRRAEAGLCLCASAPCDRPSARRVLRIAPPRAAFRRRHGARAD